MNIKKIEDVTLPPNDKTIWRYMSYARFEQLINTKELYLSRIDQFSDFNEGTLTKATEQRNSHDMNLQDASDLSGLIPWFHRFMNHKYWYASCWNCNDMESNLMWRAYGTPKKSDRYQFKIAIKTTVGK